MGTPFVIVVAGQDNVMNSVTSSWTPNTRVKVWNNVLDEESDGTAFVDPSSTEIDIASLYASKVADQDPNRDIYLIRVGLRGSDILSWVGGGRWLASQTPGVSRIAFNATNPGQVTTITIDPTDVTNTQRPAYLANAQPGRKIRISSDGLNWDYNITAVSGSALTVTYIGGPTSMPPNNWVMVEFAPMGLPVIQAAVASALNSLGKVRADSLIWWHGTGDDLNSNYIGEMTFMLNYLKQQKHWWPPAVVLCTNANADISGKPGTNTVNTQIRDAVTQLPERILADLALLPNDTWTDAGLNMTAAGYDAAASYLSSVYAYPAPRVSVTAGNIRVKRSNGSWVTLSSAPGVRIKAEDGSWLNYTGNTNKLKFLAPNNVWYQK